MTDKTVDVWEAIIDDPSERESCRIKSRIMMIIEQHIKKQGLTQQQAAEKMGVTQPRISDLTRGKIGKFTIDTLIDMLSAMGLQIEMKLKDAA
jgi:predicted XRE-type DNA-binding protein